MDDYNVLPMPALNRSSRFRYLRFVGWLFFLAVFFYLYVSRSNLLSGELRHAVSVSLLFGYIAYFFLGCIRGFTLIPSTTLVLVAIPLFPAVPLFVLTLAGILVSSTSIYYFSESLRLAEVFERKHKARVDRMKNVLQKNQAPIIILWSFFPLAPTDLICYVCGALKIDFRRFIVSVLIGEGAICGIYIFLGTYVSNLKR